MSDEIPPRLSKEDFINLLEEILESKKEKNNFNYEAPYDIVYDKCLTGYEVTRIRKEYSENVTFESVTTGKDGKKELQAKNHLKYVLESLISAYGISAVINTLKEI